MEEKMQADQLVAGGMMTAKQAAAFLGISVAGVYKLMSLGQLRYAKIGRSRRIPRNALIALAASRMVTSQADGR